MPSSFSLIQMQQTPAPHHGSHASTAPFLAHQWKCSKALKTITTTLKASSFQHCWVQEGFHEPAAISHLDRQVAFQHLCWV